MPGARHARKYTLPTRTTSGMHGGPYRGVQRGSESFKLILTSVSGVDEQIRDQSRNRDRRR